MDVEQVETVETVLCVLIDVAVKKLRLIYIVVVTVEYKLSFSLLSL